MTIEKKIFDWSKWQNILEWWTTIFIISLLHFAESPSILAERKQKAIVDGTASKANWFS